MKTLMLGACLAAILTTPVLAQPYGQDQGGGPPPQGQDQGQYQGQDQGQEPAVTIKAKVARRTRVVRRPRARAAIRIRDPAARTIRARLPATKASPAIRTKAPAVRMTKGRAATAIRVLAQATRAATPIRAAASTVRVRAAATTRAVGLRDRADIRSRGRPAVPATTVKAAPAQVRRLAGAARGPAFLPAPTPTAGSARPGRAPTAALAPGGSSPGWVATVCRPISGSPAAVRSGADRQSPLNEGFRFSAKARPPSAKSAVSAVSIHWSRSIAEVAR